MESRQTITLSAERASLENAWASGRGQRRDVASVVLLLGILLVALLVRLPGMDHRLLPDEGYTWLVGSAPDAGAFLHRLAVYENTPPLYYGLLVPLPLGDEPWIRLPSLVAGLAMLPVLFSIVRPALGARTALLSALALAVAPYAVAESNFGRAYLLADVGLLLALWGAVRLAEERGERWWWLYAAGAVIAVYSEYDAAATLAAIVLGLLLLRPDQRWRTLGLGIAPAVAFVPWIHQLARSLNDLDVTKTGLGYRNVSPGSIRDQLVTLFYGQTGQNAGAVARTAGLLVLVALIGGGVVLMHRRGARARPLLVMLAFAGLGTFVLHLLAPAFGVGIFNVGYLIFLLPIGCVFIAEAFSGVPLRLAVPGAAIVLLLAGAGLAVKRLRHDAEPDPRIIAQLARREQARTILTNSAVIAYYLRAQHAVLDRAFDLGPGLENRCTGCPRPIVIVDDADVGTGPRPGRGAQTFIGHYSVRRGP